VGKRRRRDEEEAAAAQQSALQRPKTENTDKYAALPSRFNMSHILTFSIAGKWRFFRGLWERCR
jgi:hypothetical protein